MDPATDWGYSSESGRWTLTLDGNDQRISLGGGLILPGDKTVALWVKGTSLWGADAHGAFMSRWNSSAGWLFWAISTTIRWGDGQSAELSWAGGVAAVTDGAWHHLAAVRRGSVGYIYCDGVLKASGGTFTDSTWPSGQAYIGGYSWNGTSGSLAATIADPCIWNRALSPREVSLLADPSNVHLSGLIVGRRNVFPLCFPANTWGAFGPHSCSPRR